MRKIIIRRYSVQEFIFWLFLSEIQITWTEICPICVSENYKNEPKSPLGLGFFRSSSFKKVDFRHAMAAMDTLIMIRKLWTHL